MNDFLDKVILLFINTNFNQHFSIINTLFTLRYYFLLKLISNRVLI